MMEPTDVSPKTVKAGSEEARAFLESVQEEFSVLSNTFFREMWRFLSDNFRERNDRLSTLVKQTRDQIEKSQQKTIQVVPLCEILERFIQNYLDWTHSLHEVPQEPPALFWGELNERFSEFVKEKPVFLNLDLQNHIWEFRPQDSFLEKGIKTYYRTAEKFGKHLTQLLTPLNRIFGGDPVIIGGGRRKFCLHLFFRVYYFIPLSQFLLETWEEFLKESSAQLKAFQKGLEGDLQDILFKNRFLEDILTGETGLMVLKLQSFFDQQDPAGKLAAGLTRMESGLTDRFNVFLKSVHQNVMDRWDYAGTRLLPNNHFDHKVFSGGWEKIDEQFNKTRKDWAFYFRSLQENWEKDLEIFLLEVQVARIGNETIYSIEEKHNKFLLPSLSDINEVILNSVNKFKEIHLEEGENLEESILSESRLMLRSLTREKLPAIREKDFEAQVEKIFENYLSRIRHALGQLPDQHILFLDREDDDSLLPESKKIEIALKEIVISESFSTLAQKQKKILVKVVPGIEQLIKDVMGIDQIVKYTLDTGLNLLKEDQNNSQAEAQGAVIEGLERSSDHIERLIKQNEEFVQNIKNDLYQDTIEFLHQTQSLADNEKIVDLKLRAARVKTEGEVRQFYERGATRLKNLFSSSVSFFSHFTKHIIQRYTLVKKWLGLSSPSQTVEVELVQFIEKKEKQIQELPHVYQRLFGIEPVSDEKFFEERMNELDLLKKAYQSWEKSQKSTTVLVGEKGGGKTSLILYARRRIFNKAPFFKIALSGPRREIENYLLDHLNRVFKLEGVKNLNEMEEKILCREGHVTVVVEDLQNLFIKTVDGFETLERFLLFISKTKGRVYWLLTCTLYCWNYLDHVINISKFFQNIIFIEGGNRDYIENVIMKRHRASGYALHFEPSKEGELLKKNYSSEEERQETLKKELIGKIEDFSSGNPMVALMYWLCSIEGVKEDVLRLSPNIRLDESILYRLPGMDLFALASILLHETLKGEEVSEILQQDEQDCMFTLNRLTHRGILTADEEGNFRVNPLLYRFVVGALKRKGILY